MILPNDIPALGEHLLLRADLLVTIELRPHTAAEIAKGLDKPVHLTETNGVMARNNFPLPRME